MAGVAQARQKRGGRWRASRALVGHSKSLDLILLTESCGGFQAKRFNLT